MRTTHPSFRLFNLKWDFTQYKYISLYTQNRHSSLNVAPTISKDQNSHIFHIDHISNKFPTLIYSEKIYADVNKATLSLYFVLFRNNKNKNAMLKVNLLLRASKIFACEWYAKKSVTVFYGPNNYKLSATNLISIKKK